MTVWSKTALASFELGIFLDLHSTKDTRTLVMYWFSRISTSNTYWKSERENGSKFSNWTFWGNGKNHSLSLVISPKPYMYNLLCQICENYHFLYVYMYIRVITLSQSLYPLSYFDELLIVMKGIDRHLVIFWKEVPRTQNEVFIKLPTTWIGQWHFTTIVQQPGAIYVLKLAKCLLIIFLMGIHLRCLER